MARNTQYVITHELDSTGLKHCCFVTSNYNEAVGYVETSIVKRQRDIRDNNLYNEANGNEKDNEKIIDISRFGYVEGDYAQVWTITIECRGKIEHEYFYLYYYDKEEGEQ